MLTLFYSPRACSMASHVALEEAGASFNAVRVDIFAGENLEPEYRIINPTGRVPALRFDDGRVLLESIAILGWVGFTYAEADLLGTDPLDRARTIEARAWFSSTVHPAFTRFVHPERFVADVEGQAALMAQARESFWTYLCEIDARLTDREWMMGEHFTVADPYALVFYPWGCELDLPINKLTNLTAMKDRLIARPAARRALEREKSVLLSM